MKTIAGCILRNTQNQYLLVQERQEKVRGKWNIPAGYADDGETDEMAATRETKEEVGLEVTIEGPAVHVYENPDKQRRYVAFLANIIGGEVILQEEEILDAKWLDFETISRLHEQGMIRDEWIFDALQKTERA